MIQKTCRDLRKRCKATLVVVIECHYRGQLVKIMSCAGHAGQWIWDLRRVYPGHSGIRTRRINGEDQK